MHVERAVSAQHLCVEGHLLSRLWRPDPGHPAAKVQFPEAHPCVDECCQCRSEVFLSYQSEAKHFSVDISVVSRIMEGVTDIITQTVHSQLICFSIMLLELRTPFPFLFDVLCKTPASILLAKSSPSLVLTALVAFWGGLIATKVAMPAQCQSF